MSSASVAPVAPHRRWADMQHQWRVLRVVASVQFKLKYADSSLGYLWSLIKPLSYFAVLWVVFGRFFKLNQFQHYPLFLLIGIVLFTFFLDSVSTSIPSVVASGPVIRRLSFPQLVLPMSTTLTATITFGINLIAVAVFLIVSRIAPAPSWLLIPALLAELYVFILGLAFALSAAFVKYRDVGQVWELAAQLLFYASPIMYPVGFLPQWAQYIVYLNPFVQVMQDVRYAVVGASPHGTIAAVYGTSLARLLPIAIAFGVFAVGLRYFRRRAPRFAELV